MEEKGSQGRSKKMDEEGIATLGEKCIGLDFEARPVGFVDEVTWMWNVGGWEQAKVTLSFGYKRVEMELSLNGDRSWRCAQCA